MYLILSGKNDLHFDIQTLALTLMMTIVRVSQKGQCNTVKKKKQAFKGLYESANITESQGREARKVIFRAGMP